MPLIYLLGGALIGQLIAAWCWTNGATTNPLYGPEAATAIIATLAALVAAGAVLLFWGKY